MITAFRKIISSKVAKNGGKLARFYSAKKKIRIVEHTVKCAPEAKAPCKKDKAPSSLWEMFGKETPPKPARESCRKNPQISPDPDFTGVEGQPYRTCGSAFIVQKDRTGRIEIEESDEDRALRVIEADLALKENIDDPMPPFRSVEQRLIDLSDRGLHPFYKRYMTLSKQCQRFEDTERKMISEAKQKGGQPEYVTRSGPILVDELPEQLKVTRALLERKNIMNDFKGTHLPRQILARLIEMEKNRRPTLETKPKTKETEKNEDETKKTEEKK